MNREPLKFGDLVRVFDGPNTFIGFVVKDYTTADRYRFAIATLDDPNYFNFVKGKSWKRYGLKDNLYFYEDGGRASFVRVTYDIERSVSVYYINTEKEIEHVTDFDVKRYQKTCYQIFKVYTIKYKDSLWICCYSPEVDMAEWSHSSLNEAYLKLSINIMEEKLDNLKENKNKDKKIKYNYIDPPCGPYGLSWDDLMDQTED